MKLPYFIEKILVNKFKVGNLSIELTTKIDNKISNRMYAKSLLTNYMHILYALACQTNDTDFLVSPLTDSRNKVIIQSGSYATIGDSNHLHFNAGAGIDTFGIVLSSGTTIPSPLDYSIENKISHGFGAGQLNYNVQTGVGTNLNGNTSYFDLVRTFINQSGGNVTVNKVYLITSSTGQYVIFEEKLTNSDVIPASSSYTVTIRFQITT